MAVGVCECNLLVDGKTNKLIVIPDEKYSFTFTTHTGQEHVLLTNVPMRGVIDFAAAHEIKDMYGVSNGFMFIMGKSAEGTPLSTQKRLTNDPTTTKVKL